MKELFQVHNPHFAPNAQRVTVRGKEVMATVDALEVELRAMDTSHGSIKLRFVGNDVEPAKALFVNDAMIEVSFAPAPANPKE